MPNTELVVSGLGFEATDFGWSVTLGPAYPTFFGHRLTVTIDTTPLAMPFSQLPRPNARQVNLVTFLLSRLDDAIFGCSVAFRKGCADFGIVASLAPPNIWIPPEEQSDTDWSWSLVVERALDPDDGYHIQCEGLEVVNMFAYNDLMSE